MTDLVATALGYPTVVIGVFGLVSVVGGVLVYLFTIKPALSPLNVIPGPKSTHWLFGSLKEIIDTKWSKGHFPQPALSWVKKYGGAVHYRAFLRHRVLITDPEALKHVFNTKADNYPRSTDSRLFLRVCEIIGGDGLLSSEGDAHTHMRKMLMPHFGFAKVRQFIDVFAGQTQALSAQLDRLADTNAPVDMHDLFTKLTLDIIGLSAFGYDFQSLTNQNERVMAAYKMMNQPPSILFAVGRVPQVDPLVLITDPEALKHVFNTKADNYPRSTDSRLFLRVCEIIGGDGLLSSEGDAHTHMRKMLMPHFGFAKVRQFIDVFAGQTQALSAQLNRLADTNVPVDMHDLFTKLTLDIIGLSAFGYDFQSLTNQNERVMAAYKMMNQPPSILFAVGRVYLPFFDRWPLRAIQRRNDAKRMLFQTVDDVISAKLKSPRRRTGAATDLVDLMLDNQSTEHKISAEEARTHVMTFLTAGHEVS
ncbi:hypothetical protein DYB26_009532 [Aphanomyces astaci]|uniref:Cytochrome P450 n=1 Tax=Aphanomyces astaci TaxID=112090 RepID=A0A418DZ33_APHAT|nr:hypothetical protein DYB26_009532 [Aphanomyces astaci]